MVSRSMFIGALFLLVARPVSADDEACENGVCMQEDEPGLSLLQTRAQKTNKTTAVKADTSGKYKDLGSGKCLWQPPTPPCPKPPPCPKAPPCPKPPPCPAKPKVTKPSFHYKYQEGSKCKALCEADPKCGGYSASDYNNCLLWEAPPSELLGGGKAWGACSCMVKDKKGFKDLGSGKCRWQPPTPPCPAPPPCPKAPPCPKPPPCPAKPKVTHSSFHYKYQEGSKCQELCDKDPKCGGYSASDYNNCLLWEAPASELLGGGKAWGDCSCMVKK